MIMAKTNVQNILLGIFIITGTFFLIASMYFIGARQNMFGSNFELRTVFKNINGLQKGNEVRYIGIDVGTIKEILVLSDTSIEVRMTITEDIRPFIKKDALASIGTDGLMGNKLINISPGTEKYPRVGHRDYLRSRDVLDTDNILEKLEKTNSNLLEITSGLVDNIKTINSGKNIISSLINDSTFSLELKQTLVNLRKTSEYTLMISADLDKKLNGISNEDGSLLALLGDTTISEEIFLILGKIKTAGDHTQHMARHLDSLIADFDPNEQFFNVLTRDTQFIDELKTSATNIREGTESVNQVLEALKQSFLFRKYFKRIENENQDRQKD